MDLIDLAKKYRSVLQELLITGDDYLVVEAPNLADNWESGRVYITGAVVRYQDVLYRCLQAHDSMYDWNPKVAPSLWAKILTSLDEDEVLPWEQPDSTNPYMMGDRVEHNGVIYESLIDNNVWQPGIVGTESLWIEVE